MKIQEYRVFVLARLAEVEAEYGNISVVAWDQSGKRLSEPAAIMMQVENEGYFLAGDHKGPDIPVLVIGP